MPVASSRAGAEELPRPPIRIRTLLALGLLAGLAWAAYPRATAAWKLHSAASTLANYALCMVGPTGPALLRDNPGEFRVLVRRRLVSSPANERPFAECAKAAGELTGSVEIERAHRATAWSFVEYGGPAADRARHGSRGQLSIDGLRVTTRPVAELAERAWPFARGGWTRLVKPSMGAREAVHPVELPRPAIGRGLPAWRSHYRALAALDGGHLLAVGKGANLSAYRTRDGGVSWTPAPLRGAAEVGERCPAGERAYTFNLNGDGRLTMVTSAGPDGPPSSTPLAGSELAVVASACDADALVAAVKTERGRDANLLVCPYRQRCRALPLPRFAGVGALPRFPLDVARVEGTTVLSVVMHSVVRVASTRDDGRSWTPWTVAFDAAAHPDLHVHVKLPGRLLVLGKRVLLYGGGKTPSETYPLLVSEDLGASWRAPEVLAEPVAAQGE